MAAEANFDPRERTRQQTKLAPPPERARPRAQQRATVQRATGVIHVREQTGRACTPSVAVPEAGHAPSMVVVSRCTQAILRALFILATSNFFTYPSLMLLVVRSRYAVSIVATLLVLAGATRSYSGSPTNVAT